MGKTSIEWVKGADGSEGMSWNALRAVRKSGGRPGVTANHCEHVNEACRFCYAEKLNARLGGLPFKPGHRKDYNFTVDEETLRAPLRRRKPTRYFVESMSDAFGDWWPTHFIDALYAVMGSVPHHTFINLSKRPDRRRIYLSDPETVNRVVSIAGGFGDRILGQPWPLPNVIEGTSVSCQAEADEFVPILLATKCALRCVSAEPLLGPIDFGNLPSVSGIGRSLDSLNNGGCEFSDAPGKLDWIIVGGESGQNARPMHPDWARSIRDQCDASGVAFHFKQHGAWIGASDLRRLPGGQGPGFGKYDHCRFDQAHDAVLVGKKASGRKLDGREHNGFPSI